MGFTVCEYTVKRKCVWHATNVHSYIGMSECVLHTIFVFICTPHVCHIAASVYISFACYADVHEDIPTTRNLVYGIKGDAMDP